MLALAAATRMNTDPPPAASADPLAVFGVGRFARWISRLALRLAGWRAEGSVPDPPRFVLIAAPHTTNWDAVIMLLAARVLRIRISWFVKHTWFRGSTGWLLRALGGFPIDRRAKHNVVAQVVERFHAGGPLIVAVPPEGTRRRVEHWKTGFYHIAVGAQVPLVMGFIDYGRKVAGFGPVLVPTGDLEADFGVLRDFYSRITPLHPEKMGPIAPPPRV